MSPLLQQVSRARRRMALSRLLSFLVLGWTVGLTLALGAVALDKWLPLGQPLWVWPAGGLALGLAFALAATWWTRATSLEAAWEIDRRFELRERVSSSLLLGETDRQTPAGAALVADAGARVERLHLPERFAVRPSRWSWLPLVPAIGLFLVATFVHPVDRQAATAQAATEGAQVKKSTAKLAQKLEERRRQLEKAGLKDAEHLFEKLEKGTSELSRGEELDRKQTLVKLNSLSQDLAKRREQLGGADQLRQQLNQMRGFERGPADRLAQALRQGDFRQAAEELKKLQDGLKQGQLDDQAREQLTKQVEQLAKKLGDMARAERAEREALEKQLAQKRAEGREAEAEELSKKLDELNRREAQTSQLEKLASKLGECRQSLEKGDSAQAAAQLDAMQAELDSLAQQMDELEALEGALGELAEAKESMGCAECEGDGCAACQGRARGQFPGRGLGEGQGEGDRPEERTETGNYDTQVRQKVGRGPAVVTDWVEGPNVKGDVAAEIAAQFEAARTEATDPLTEQQLPADVRDHARDYFESLREGRE